MQFNANLVQKPQRQNMQVLSLPGFVFPNSFLFPYFNSNILYSVHLFGISWPFTIALFSNDLFQAFDNL